MHILSHNDEKLFRSIVNLSQEKMKKVLYSCLTRKYKKVHYTEEYIYAEGNIPIALVAHMDTVFPQPPTHIYYDKQNGVMWSPEGLGADDRAGIFLILKIIQSGLRPTVIFTTDEEIGAIGAEKLVNDFKEPPNTINYIIQLDRRGSDDCVFYNCANDSFVKYIETFGFVENFGTFSDISEICPAWGIAGTNVSVGYENEHSYIETLHINALFKTLNRVKTMLNEKNVPFFKYVSLYREQPKMYKLISMDMAEPEIKCHHCGFTFSEYEVIPVHTENDTVVNYCPDCCIDNVSWCHNCGQAFEDKGKIKYVKCFKCRGKGDTNECLTTLKTSLNK